MSSEATGTRIVVCAVDLGPLTSRVLYHAAGFARALGARLKVVHIAESSHSMEGDTALKRAYARAIPHQSGGGEPDLAVRTGAVVERILEEANRPGVEMLVTGTRALGPVATAVLGSTSQSVLRGARVPVLLVPPTDIDIVFVESGRASITCGPVLAAVDLAEANGCQLRTASAFADLAGEPLLLVTVASDATDDRAVATSLRTRSHGLIPRRPTAFIVRRGDVAEQIAQCARAEHAGLVVMGLRNAARGRPGANASSVLRTGRAFVMAVPEGDCALRT